MVSDEIQKASHLSAEELAALAQPQDGLCVSLYLPTHRAGKDIRQDPIRLKNRIADAEARLDEFGDEADALREPLRELRERCDLESEENQEFWRHQEDGLAILLAEGQARTLKLSVETPEETVVAHRYYVRPLIKAVGRDGEYAVVAVSRNGVRFLEGSKRGLSETEIDDLPESLRAVVGGDEQKGFNLHSIQNAGRAGGEDAVPHGHVDKDEFEALKRYFNEIAEAVDEALHVDPRPIVFAGVDELFPYFRDACKGTRLELADEHVAGNPDDASPEQLHEKAWPAAAACHAERAKSLIAQYREQEHGDTATSDLREIVTAAENGRVESLILESNCRAVGSYDPTQRRVQVDEADRGDGIDLVDLAAAKTLNSGGRVTVLDADQFDFAESGVAAVLRYAIKKY
ncbi:MAG: hypothetical protein AAF266_16030 [Planctomycetota bacterium]